MIKMKRGFFLVLLLATQVARADGISLFEQRINSFSSASDPTLPTQVNAAAELLRYYQVVFVTGFFGRHSVGYLVPDKQALRDAFAVTDGASDIDEGPTEPSEKEMRPSSFFSTESNARRLHDNLLRLYRNHGKRILLVAHSKGAAEAFYASLAYPDLTGDEIVKGGVVAKFILVNAAIGGSLLADVVDSGGSTIGEPGSESLLNPLLLNPLFYPSDTPIVPIRELLPALPGWGGLVTMRREEARKIMSILYNGTRSAQIQAASDRILYVRTYANASEVPWYVRWTKEVSDALGINDGVVLAKEQCANGIGKDMGLVSNAYHMKLASLSHGTQEYITAFIKALFTSPEVFPELAGKVPDPVPANSNSDCFSLQHD